MRQDTDPPSGFWTPVRIALAAAIVAAIAWVVFRGSAVIAVAVGRLADVLVTLVLAVALAYIVWPVVAALERPLGCLKPRTRRAVSALIVIVGFVVGLVAVAVLIAGPLVGEVGRLGVLARQWLMELPEQMDRSAHAWAKYLPPDTLALIQRRIVDYVTSLFAGQVDVFRGLVLRGWYVVELFLVPVLAFYFVTDGTALAEQFVAKLPASRRERVRVMGVEMNALMHSYVRAQVVLCFVMALSTSLILYLAGVRVYLTLGVLAGLGWAVPMLGPVIAGVPIVGVCLAQQGLRIALLVLIAYAGINALQNKVIMPNVLSAGARLHPVAVIVAILVGAEFLGVLGMFIAVPAAAVLRVVVANLHTAGAPAEEPE